MSDPLESLHLKLPYLAAAQAQKHVTHNEALRLLDSVVQLAVLDTTLADPPASPAEGDRYIVADSATGDWATHEGEIAHFIDGAWAFAVPEPGWLAFDRNADVLLVWQPGGWVAAGSFLGAVDMFGVNATADATNRLAVRSESVLFAGIEAADGGSGDIRFVVNKEADGDTASLLFQSGYSARAEVGLAGDTDFIFKVSPDGASWVEAIRIDKDTGLVTLLYDNGASGLSATTVQDAIDEVAAGGGGGLREVLTVARTYYVRSDGDDGNDGLTNDSGGALATLQEAYDRILMLDCAGYDVTIKIGNTATLTAGLNASKAPLGGNVIIEGDTSTPANTIISTTGVDCIQASCPVTITVQYLELRTTSSGLGLGARGGGALLQVGTGVRFGACATGHMGALPTSNINSAVANVAYTMSGNAPYHYGCLGGAMNFNNPQITLEGTPAFSFSFAYSDIAGQMSIFSLDVVSGSATGKRYTASLNGVIKTFGGGASYFPGDSAGSMATGGQYA